MPDVGVPLNRWGRILAPESEAGSWVLVEQEKPDFWKKPPSADAYRIWLRKPGVTGDDPRNDFNNWSVWLHAENVAPWFEAEGYRFAEWLPEGEEPDWNGA